MNNIIINYDDNIEKGENQYYRHYDLSEEKKVDAIYIRSYACPGNPFVEALPRFLTPEQVINNNHRIIAIPDLEELDQMDLYEKNESITQLNEIRFPIPFHADVERELHNALVSSYKMRTVIYDSSVDIKYTISGKEEITHEKMIAKQQSASVTGFSLLGVSGSGKSSCINMLLDHYPQVITHYTDDNIPIRQIVYIMVICPQGSNFNVLYREIGKQIDIALGNVIPVYEEQIRKQKSLGNKAEEVAKLIELFHIGIIIFDEIQQINVSTSQENSIESLLTLNNTTNVAIAVIGTEEAYGKLFTRRRVARRLGTYILASKYCTNKKICQIIVYTLFKYSWVSTISSPNEDIYSVIYDTTHGIIDQIITLYKFIQYDLIRAEENAKRNNKAFKTIIDSEFIRETIKTHNLDNHLYDYKSPEPALVTAHLNQFLSPAESDAQRESEMEMNAYFEKEDIFKRSLRRDKISKTVFDKTKGKYKLKMIETVFDKVYSIGQEQSDDEILIKIIQSLEKRDEQHIIKQLGKEHKPTHDKILTEIMENHNTGASIIDPPSF